jgi:SAM-dependent methyltransferase
MNGDSRRFYSRPGLHVQIYDDQTAGEWGTPQNDTAFYLEEAKAGGGPVLELGCGTGRLLIPLLSTGYDVHGLDASSAMLEVARRKREQLPAEAAKRTHLHHGDMCEFALGQQFAFVFIAFRSFQNLLTPEAQRRCLVCVRRHLASNGKAIINLFDPKYDLILPGRHEGVQRPRDVIHPVSGNRVLVETLERVNDPLTQIFKERWRFTETDPNGEVVRQEEEYLELRWTFRYEMRHLVESCGLVVEAEYSDFQRSPPEYGKEQVWVLSRY